MREFPSIETVLTKEDAIDIAQEWQQEQSKCALSWQGIANASAYFTELANKFGLTEEFQENGII